MARPAADAAVPGRPARRASRAAPGRADRAACAGGARRCGVVGSRGSALRRLPGDGAIGGGAAAARGVPPRLPVLHRHPRRLRAAGREPRLRRTGAPGRAPHRGGSEPLPAQAAAHVLPAGAVLEARPVARHGRGGHRGFGPGPLPGARFDLLQLRLPLRLRLLHSGLRSPHRLQQGLHPGASGSARHAPVPSCAAAVSSTR